MKKHVLFLLAFIATLTFVSCSDSPDALSPSRAEKLFKKEMKRLDKLNIRQTIQTGYFECNSDLERTKYRKLAANELVTYKCDRVMKPDRVRKYRIVRRSYGWSTYNSKEYYWDDVLVPTYFVTIALTEKGQKLVYKEKEIEKTDDEKDLREDMEIDLSKYPESSVGEETFPPLPDGAEPPVDEPMDDVDETLAESFNTTPAPAAKQKEKNDYEKAKEKEKIEEVVLLAAELDIVKARNVRKTGDFEAEAEILLEFDDVNAVGRIFGQVYEGKRFLTDKLRYVYYEDKGWQLKE